MPVVKQTQPLCNKLSSIVWHIPKHNDLIISGGVNAQMSKDRIINSAYTICQTEMVNI